MPMFWIGRCLRISGGHIRTTLVAGVLVVVPLGVTIIILKVLFDFFDDLLKPVYDQFTDVFKPGMGIATLVLVIYLSGLVTTHFLGRRMIRFGHSLIDRVPVVNSIYRTARAATEVFSNVSSDGKFSSVVLVEFPGHGLQSIGLVTSKIKDKHGKTLLSVYMPTSPVPTSGFLVILPEDKVTPTDMPVDDAIKLIVSAGVMAPDRINANPDVSDASPTDAPLPAEDEVGASQPTDKRASNQ